MLNILRIEKNLKLKIINEDYRENQDLLDYGLKKDK
jgi:hypothetical protein